MFAFIGKGHSFLDRRDIEASGEMYPGNTKRKLCYQKEANGKRIILSFGFDPVTTWRFTRRSKDEYPC